jgi:predicted dithiol-disulfide oxidoreductase (DUF899 family)
VDSPEAVTQSEWREAREALLAREKELTRLRDELSAERRRLPMVELEKEYRFVGPGGEVALADLFEARGQLLIYHFMWLADEGAGCPSCSFVVDNIGDLRHLHARDTTLALVSRGPFDDLEGYRRRMGWNIPWYSSLGSDFNYDFHVTADEDVAPVEYNYRDAAELARRNPAWQGWKGEQPGASAFLREGDRVFHTYSSYGRALDILMGTYNWLDLTARGRQESWERPPGRNDGSGGMQWLRRHDEYPAASDARAAE